MKELISVKEARELVRQAAARLAPNWAAEHVALDEVSGRVLAEDVVSQGPYPPFASSAMDGFAVAPVSEAGTVFRVVGESRAGLPFTGALREGEAVRIATGAVVPDGTAVVVPVEMVDAEAEGSVSFTNVPEQGSHIRPPGKDVRSGEKVLTQGSTVRVGAVPMLAMLGVASVPVRVRPSVALITTGDELLAPAASDPLPPGMIRDSNGPGLAALARAIGCTVRTSIHAGDSPEALRSALEEAREADLILLSGGVSMGPHDHVRPVLADAGVDLVFWRVRQRPGKPLAFGVQRSGQLVFGLPGNPVSSAVCFLQYVRVAAETMMGQFLPESRFAQAWLTRALWTKEGLYHFIRGHAEVNDEGRLHVAETGAQDSNLISSLLRANCLIHVPENTGHAQVGERVQIEWLPI